MQAQVPSGSARDAVSIPREFNNQFANFKSENEKRKSSKNESLIHRCYFGLNRQGIAAIKITTITELSTIFSYHVAIIAIVMIKWKPGLTDTFANKVHCLIKFVCANFGPSLCGRCSPPSFFCGNPTMVWPRSITTLCWPILPYFSAHLLYCQYNFIILSLVPLIYPALINKAYCTRCNNYFRCFLLCLLFHDSNVSHQMYYINLGSKTPAALGNFNSVYVVWKHPSLPQRFILNSGYTAGEGLIILTWDRWIKTNIVIYPFGEPIPVQKTCHTQL